MIIDLHTHTNFSDGALSIEQHLELAGARGYDYIAVTDHVTAELIPQILPLIIDGCRRFNQNTHHKLRALPGVELTHLPAEEIPAAVTLARKLGAKIVGVHGETIIDEIIVGTNHYAIVGGADFLAHPGILSEEDARLAAEKGIFLEITSRKGHSLTNGRVAKLAIQYAAPILINSDAHRGFDLYDEVRYNKVAIGSGLTSEHVREILERALRLVQSRL
ncbi:MAG: histidinol phosphate phosphatase domain-containing protein [Oligoflexia bacterium]|nr:histidinol phosphate phosphatase domain-containing protein [Oligoflexia bacterium]